MDTAPPVPDAPLPDEIVTEPPTPVALDRPLAIVMVPDVPEFATPLDKTTLPLYTPDADDTMDKAPDVPVFPEPVVMPIAPPFTVPVPAVILIAPPAAAEAVLVPAVNEMMPPLPVSPDPTATYTEPPLPVVAEPVPMTTLPAVPCVAVPVLKLK